ncbi:MAG: hypothetical protein SOW42_01890 [Methanobrevibacter sp.]|nr:hypothetical protein [Methanobrevibacter sp.]
MKKDNTINGIIPIARGVPPLTLGYKLPKYPLFPKNRKMIFKIAVLIAVKIKTIINAIIIDE